MKKIFLMAAIALFMAMTSCSGDDSSESTNPDTSSVFLTKIEETYDDGSSESSVFTYDGNKLIKEDYTDGGYAVYEYSNNHISQILTREGGGQTSWTYTFDAKNSPGKNFTAGDILALAYQEGGINNIVSYVNESYDEGYTITYQYNEVGYPISDTETDIDGTVTTTQYFYE